MVFFRSIRFRLFSVYSIIIVLIFVSFFAFFYIYSKNTIEENEFRALHSQSEFISNAIDAQLRDADWLTQSILFSSRIKDLFYDRIFLDEIDYNQVREFYTLVHTIVGPQQPMRQINIFDESGRFISVGTYSTAMRLEPDAISAREWVQHSIELNGRRYVLEPSADSWGLHSFKVVSVTRSFPRYFGGKPENIIEAQMDADKVFETAIEASSDFYVTIIDSNGYSIFPLVRSEEDYQLARIYFDEYHNPDRVNRSPYGVFTVTNPAAGGTDCVSVIPLGRTDWFVAVSKPLDDVLEPVTRLAASTIILGVFVLTAMLFVTYGIARRITTPITRIHRSIEELNLKMLPEDSQIDVEKGLDELERLQIAYNNMTKKLNETLDEVITARSMEAQSKLLALQAQMNPHFLFNTLSIISVLAEENDNYQIMGISDRLIKMLREILYETRENVKIKQELKHTEDYLQLLKIRFDDLLQFEIDVPEELRQVYVPHLILQPLVENCAKYAVSGAPPWIIKIRGDIDENLWRLWVSDNGEGFSEDAAKHLEESMQSYSELIVLSRMGLRNIYTRLKIRYGEKAIFRFGNNEPNGAFVEIGGCIDIDA